MVTKSWPKKTPLTPSTLNNCRASGEPRADMGDGKSSVPVRDTHTHKHTPEVNCVTAYNSSVVHIQDLYYLTTSQ